MGAPPFSEVIAGARAGDGRSFALLWRQYHPRVVRYLRVMAGDAADDLASETWLHVARDLHRFEGDEPGFRGWLFTIARRRHLDWCRAQARRPRLVSDDGLETSSDAGSAELDPAVAMEHRWSSEAALAAIATLPPDQAEVVTLRSVVGLDVAEVAELLGKQPGNVRVLAHRGLQRLAVALARAQALEV
jgi:RNA polymerase sigma-70 factor, ECF subfamily